MTRIFFALAVFAVALLVSNIVLGLVSGNYNSVADDYRQLQLELRDAEMSASSAEQVRDLKSRRNEVGRQLERLERKNGVHLLLGLAASLVSLLVNSITVTYFIGTSRWCKEVVETYQLDAELAEQSNRLKRGTFPWALAGVVTTLVIVILGGAALPFNPIAEHSADWVIPHYGAAIFGTGFIAWSFLIQVGNIGANYRVIQQILDEVHTVRQQRGLDADRHGERQTT